MGSEDKDSKQTSESFGYKWDTWKNIAYRKDVVDYHKKWFLKRYNWKTEEKFLEFLSNKKRILDAGCGLGRFTKWFHELLNESKDPSSDYEVIGIDISDAVEIARERYGENTHLKWIKGDLNQLQEFGSPDKYFDYIACEGVIHHTPDPKLYFGRLCEYLEDDGFISAYIYRKKPLIRELIDKHVRDEITSKLSIKECKEFCEQITKLGKNLRDLDVKVEVPEIPLLGIEGGRQDLQRFIYWNFIKCWWDDNGDWERSMAVNFDWYHPEHAYRFAESELKSWCKSYGLEIVNFYREKSAFSLLAKKLPEK